QGRREDVAGGLRVQTPGAVRGARDAVVAEGAGPGRLVNGPADEVADDDVLGQDQRTPDHLPLPAAVGGLAGQEVAEGPVEGVGGGAGRRAYGRCGIWHALRPV